MSLEPLLVRLRRGGLVADGAWGSVLLARGLPPGHPPEAWTLDRPHTIKALAREYLDAGAELVTTNTFGGSPSRLRLHHLDDRLDEVNRRGVEIVRGAVAGRAYVSASIGPSGLLLKPFGEADPGAIEEGFRRQASVLASAGADAICIETMTDLIEASCAIRAARAAAPGVPIVATMSFDLTPRGPHTIMGVSVAQAARGLADAGADIVGANCGTGVDAMIEVARAFQASTSLPIAIRPNAGLPERQGERLVYRETPERFAAAAVALLAGGIAIVGGCCGTTPAHIRALVNACRPPRTPGRA
jgi:5-methyltetrahydrofolate--homocysteine methyltransferase